MRALLGITLALVSVPSSPAPPITVLLANRIPILTSIVTEDPSSSVWDAMAQSPSME
jgi:hypothetical protein